MNLTSRAARLAAAGTAAAALAVVAVASPAQAAAGVIHVTRPDGGNGTTHFHYEYGASVLNGDVNFTNRSVIITGTIKAVSASRTADIFGFNPDVSCYVDTTRTAPAGTLKAFGPITASCDVAGGFSEVTIWFPV